MNEIDASSVDFRHAQPFQIMANPSHLRHGEYPHPLETCHTCSISSEPTRLRHGAQPFPAYPSGA